MVTVQITREYPEIAIAHKLNGMYEGHKCGRLHGHNYVVSVTLRGWPGNNGMIVDAEDIDKVVKPVLAKLDHQYINELGLLSVSDQPTAENLAVWLWNQFCVELPWLHAVRVHENSRLCAEAIRL